MFCQNIDFHFNFEGLGWNVSNFVEGYAVLVATFGVILNRYFMCQLSKYDIFRLFCNVFMKKNDKNSIFIIYAIKHFNQLRYYIN